MTTGVGQSMLRDIQGQFGALMIDPPWPFKNRTGKVAPEHKRLHRYNTLSLNDIYGLPVGRFSLPQSHLYLWCPVALMKQGLDAMDWYGFQYKTTLFWYKVRKDGGPDRRGVGFYFRGVIEICLF